MESVEIQLRRSGNVSNQKAEIGDYRKVTLVNGWMEFYYSVKNSNIQKKKKKERKNRQQTVAAHTRFSSVFFLN